MSISQKILVTVVLGCLQPTWACGCGAMGHTGQWSDAVRLEWLVFGFGLNVAVFAVYGLCSCLRWLQAKWVRLWAQVSVLHTVWVLWVFDSGADIWMGWYAPENAMMVQLCLFALPMLQAAYQAYYRHHTPTI